MDSREYASGLIYDVINAPTLGLCDTSKLYKIVMAGFSNRGIKREAILTDYGNACCCISDSISRRNTNDIANSVEYAYSLLG